MVLLLLKYQTIFLTYQKSGINIIKYIYTLPSKNCKLKQLKNLKLVLSPINFEQCNTWHLLVVLQKYRFELLIMKSLPFAFTFKNEVLNKGFNDRFSKFPGLKYWSGYSINNKLNICQYLASLLKTYYMQLGYENLSTGVSTEALPCKCTHEK